MLSSVGNAATVIARLNIAYCLYCQSTLVKLISYTFVDVVFLQYASKAVKQNGGSVEGFYVEFIARDGNWQIIALQLQGSLY